MSPLSRAQMAVLMLGTLFLVSCQDDTFAVRYAEGICKLDKLCHWTDGFEQSFCLRHEEEHFLQTVAACKAYDAEFEAACLIDLEQALQQGICNGSPSVQDDEGPCGQLATDCGNQCWPFEEGQELGHGNPCQSSTACYWDDFFGFPNCAASTASLMPGQPCQAYSDCAPGYVCSSEQGDGICATWCTAPGGVFESLCAGGNECIPLPGGEGFFGYCLTN